MDWFVSYAQNFEDVMLHRALGHVEKGFYIDVGAQDPLEDSVTQAFYERGWRGINIEPVRHWYDRLKQQRTHDINLRVAVADGPGTLKLFEVEDTGLSTIDPALAQRQREEGKTIRERKIASKSLDQICEENKVEVVHFLKIDCEGAEKQALQGFSFDAVRPWIVLVEATEPNSTKPTHAQWEHLLTDHGYAFVYSDGINRFYVAQEHQELRAAFGWPPNVLDFAMHAREVRALERARQSELELARTQDFGRIARAEAICNFLDRENRSREEALVGLRAALQDLQRVISEREVQLAQAGEEREFLRTENERRETALAQFRDAVKALEATIGERDTQLAQANGERDFLRQENERREAALVQLREVVQGLQRSDSDREARLMRLSDACDALRLEKTQQEAQVQNLGSELAHMRERERGLEELLRATNAHLVHAEAGQADLRELLQLREAASEQSRIESQRIAESFRAALDQTRQTLAAREVELDWLRRDLTAVLHSHSWRASAPLRWAGRAVRWTLHLALLIALFILRPFARLARPTLRRLARNSRLRRCAVGLLGKNSFLIRHARLFLFGAPTRAPVPPAFDESAMRAVKKAVLSSGSGQATGSSSEKSAAVQLGLSSTLSDDSETARRDERPSASEHPQSSAGAIVPLSQRERLVMEALQAARDAGKGIPGGINAHRD